MDGYVTCYYTCLPPSVAEEQRAHDHQHNAPDAGPNRGGTGQPAFIGVVTSLLVLDDVLEFRLHQLTVEIGDLIVERILESLQALAFVSARLEASAQNWHALWTEMAVFLIRSAEFSVVSSPIYLRMRFSHHTCACS